MNTQRMRNKWTEENIDYLKIAYLKGSPLKQMAAKLDRTVSAISKALTRFELRTQTKKARFPSLSRPTLLQLQQRRNLGTRIRQKNRKGRANFLSDYRGEVLFEYVIYWMRSEGISVIKSKSDVYYEVNGIPKNPAQILLIANEKREELKLPIFYVKGITHS